MEALAEIAFRLLTSGKKGKLGLTGWISVIGIILGVACLSVSMAVMSGFVSTLQKSLTDVSGDIQVFKLRQNVTSAEFNDKIIKAVPELKAKARFFSVEGVLAHQGRVHGAALQGFEPADLPKVLNLGGRVKAGKLELVDGDIPKTLIGKGVAEFFGLKPGDRFRLIVPLQSEFDPHEFRRKVGQFEVAGVMELGKYEYDERMIIMPLRSLQRLANVDENKDSGVILKIEDSNKARKVAIGLGNALGVGFRVRDWRDINENIFDAVDLERVIVFFVIMVIVIASAFNVATSLYVNVIQRYPEIGILKAMGVSSRKMIFVLCAQGFFLGLFGCAAGLVLGLILGYLFEWAEVHLGILPESVYRVAHIELSFRFVDSITIVVVTLLICVIATLAPARRGARLSPVEGLRYD